LNLILRWGGHILKIAYIVHDPSEKYDGVNKKILNTVVKWKELGTEAKLFIFVNEGYQEPMEFQSSPYVHIIRYKNKKEFYMSKDLCLTITEWNPDALYIRGITPYYSKSVRLLRKSIVSIQEINTNDKVEIRNILTKSIKSLKFTEVRWTLFYLMMRKICLKKVDGFVLLNHELKKVIPSHIPFTVVGDGINLNDYPIVDERKSHSKSNINIVFMGTSNHPWYGIDKIIYLANHMPEYTFHFIGLNRASIKQYRTIHDNIMFYGFLGKEQYEEVLEEMDVAIGSLSLHVNEMHEGSPLKGREYLAYGLPTIIGYKDTDFMEEVPPFILELPSSENNVVENMGRINKFIQTSKTVNIPRRDIGHLDYKLKEKRRLDFIKQTCQQYEDRR
jgi:hypothetical protein